MKPGAEDNEVKFSENMNLKGGFIVPDLYFTELTQKVMSRTTGSGFKVPDNYFENTSESILSKTEIRKPYNIRTLYPYIQWAAAACLVLVSIVVFKDQRMNLNKEELNYTAEMNKLSDEEIIAYIDFGDIQDPAMFEALNVDEKTRKQAEKYLMDQDLTQELDDLL